MTRHLPENCRYDRRWMGRHWRTALLAANSRDILIL
jgi:hypothetical protein